MCNLMTIKNLELSGALTSRLEMMLLHTEDDQ